MVRKYLLGVDAGGTFTDFILLEQGEELCLRLHKTLSTPQAPEKAIVQGIQALGLEEFLGSAELEIIHGSTVATNAVLEGKLARTAYISNYGFGDTLQLARQTRPELYALDFPPKGKVVAKELCLETGGRVGADGCIVEGLSKAQLEKLLEEVSTQGPEAVAINLLFSFLDDSFEKKIEAALNKAQPSLFVSRSSEVLPEYKEYERGIATWLNAALGPVVSGYLGRLEKRLNHLSLQIMQSSGETIAAKEAAASAVRLLLSGPAGGLTAVSFIGKKIGEDKLISFDMGGTSTDVALLDGEISTSNESSLGHYPVAIPMVDMHTIGAGGGSIAFIDSGGMLQVGPESAGADPGPACYGRGGTEATVSDANLLLGRLLADASLAGFLKLDKSAAENAIKSLADKMDLSVLDAASGIVTIANERMAKAIRLISVNRGYDPEEFLLCSFGGAGGLHVCAIAEAMGMSRAIIPVNAGALSALGMVTARPGRQFSKTLGIEFGRIDEPSIIRVFEQLENHGIKQLEKEGLDASELKVSRSADIRYCGQSYTLNLPWHGKRESAQLFEQRHLKHYGFKHGGFEHKVEKELLNIRVKVEAPARNIILPPREIELNCNKARYCEVYGEEGQVLVIAREGLVSGMSLNGPAIITEYSATSYLSSAWSLKVDRLGNLILKKQIKK